MNVVWADRQQVEERLQALIADFLDSRGDDSDVDLDLGVVALVAEVKHRRPPESIERLLEERKRPEAVYTPEAEWTHTIWYRCTDLRDWIASGLFRQAMLVADGDYDQDDDEDEAAESS